MGNKLSRSGLNNETQTKIATNNSKAITAAVDRDVRDSFSKSKFNLVDDDLSNIKIDPLIQGFASDNALGLIIELIGKVNALPSIIAQGTIQAGDFPGGGTGNKNVTGDFSSANVLESNGPDARMKVNGTFGTDEYIVLTSISVNGNFNASNDVVLSSGQEQASSFEIYAREVAGQIQNYTIKVVLLKFNPE